MSKKLKKAIIQKKKKDDGMAELAAAAAAAVKLAETKPTATTKESTKESSKPTSMEIDVFIGRGGKMNKMRQYSLYSKLLNDNYEEYKTLCHGGVEKRQFVWERIIWPITDAGGKFWKRKSKREDEWIEAKYEHVARTVMQALRDRRKGYGNGCNNENNTNNNNEKALQTTASFVVPPPPSTYVTAPIQASSRSLRAASKSLLRATTTVTATAGAKAAATAAATAIVEVGQQESEPTVSSPNSIGDCFADADEPPVTPICVLSSSSNDESMTTKDEDNDDCDISPIIGTSDDDNNDTDATTLVLNDSNETASEEEAAAAASHRIAVLERNLVTLQKENQYLRSAMERMARQHAQWLEQQQQEEQQDQRENNSSQYDDA